MTKLALLVMFFASHVSFAQFMPDNDLYKDDNPFETQMAKEDFERLIKEVADFYAPIIKGAHGANLVFVNRWEDPTVNAFAVQVSPTRWEVHMFGGLARRPEITNDAFQMVACHEMGHHLGGFPFVQSWAANEGQADYFSTLSCARDIWKDQVKKNAEFAKSVESFPKRACDAAWKTEEEKNLCYRVSVAGKSLAMLLSGGSARYETPDRRRVTATYNAHPAGQCRLDTYLAGAVCKAEFNNEVIPKTEEESADYTCSNRPRCWFKPAGKAF